MKAASILVSNTNIKQHQSGILLNTKGLKFPCDQFNYQATTKGSLAKHRRVAHEGVRFPCRYCNKQYTRREHLTKHQRNLHLKDCEYNKIE